jgi:hypothetical protein
MSHNVVKGKEHKIYDLLHGKGSLIAVERFLWFSTVFFCDGDNFFLFKNNLKTVTKMSDKHKKNWMMNSN